MRSTVAAFQRSLRDLAAQLQNLLRVGVVLRDAHRRTRAAPPRADAPAVLFRRAAAVGKLAPVERQPYDGPGRRLFRPVPVGPFCSATYVSIESSCPDRCPFKRAPDGGPGGCFANEGFTRFAVQKLDRGAVGKTALELAVEEAKLIGRAWAGGVPQDGARGGRDLRLHISGDVKSTEGAAVLAVVAEDWLNRGGGAVFTYTHAWRDVPRKAWGRISVLASVESAEQLRAARARGYAAALVVREFPNGDRAFDVGGGVKAIPCPAETRGRTCVECRLCLDRDLLSLKRAIAFKVHGTGAGRALSAISGGGASAPGGRESLGGSKMGAPPPSPSEAA